MSEEHLSWLALERLALEELSAPHHRAARGHLVGCAECQERYEALRADQRPLPALSATPTRETDAARPDAAQASAARPARRGERWWRRWLVVGGPGLALAAVLLLMWAPWGPGAGPGAPVGPGAGPGAPVGPEGADGAAVTPKGGALVLSVLRERGGTLSDGPTTYRAGDRFRLEVTCAPPRTLRWRVEVRQGGEVFDPYPGRAPVMCRNQVALPGAFRVTGDGPLEVCLVDEGADPLNDGRPTCATLRSE